MVALLMLEVLAFFVEEVAAVLASHRLTRARDYGKALMNRFFT